MLAVTIPERPGSFRAQCELLGKRNVTEFNYRIADPSQAHVCIGVTVSGREETERLIGQLQRAGLKAVDLSDNEMAKLHVRYMVGGRAAGVSRERVCRFEFPERPGALLQFLDTLGGRWNISLFHYLFNN